MVTSLSFPAILVTWLVTTVVMATAKEIPRVTNDKSKEEIVADYIRRKASWRRGEGVIFEAGLQNILGTKSAFRPAGSPAGETMVPDLMMELYRQRLSSMDNHWRRQRPRQQQSDQPSDHQQAGGGGNRRHGQASKRLQFSTLHSDVVRSVYANGKQCIINNNN